MLRTEHGGRCFCVGRSGPSDSDAGTNDRSSELVGTEHVRRRFDANDHEHDDHHHHTQLHRPLYTHFIHLLVCLRSQDAKYGDQRSVSVSSALISQKPRVQMLLNFLYMLPLLMSTNSLSSLMLIVNFGQHFDQVTCRGKTII